MINEIVTSDYIILEDDSLGMKWFFDKHEEHLVKYFRRKKLGQLIFTTYFRINYGEDFMSYKNMQHITKTKHVRFGDVETLRKEYFDIKRNESGEIIFFEDSDGNWYDNDLIKTSCPFQPNLTSLHKIYTELRGLINGNNDLWDFKRTINLNLSKIEQFVKQK